MDLKEVKNIICYLFLYFNLFVYLIIVITIICLAPAYIVSDLYKLLWI